MKLIKIIMLLFIASGCKPQKSNKIASEIKTADQIVNVNEAPEKELKALVKVEDKKEVILKEKAVLQKEIKTYLETTKNDPQTIESLELQNNLSHILPLTREDDKTIETIIEQKTLTRADEKTDEMVEELKAEVDDKNKVEGLLKGTAIYAVILAGLGVVGTSYLEIAKYNRMTTSQHINVSLRGGLYLMTAIVAAQILSKDKASESEKNVLAAMLGVTGLVQLGSGIYQIANPGLIKEQGIKWSLREQLIKEGHVFGVEMEADRIYNEALTKKLEPLELPKLKDTKIVSEAKNISLLDRARYKIHAEEVNTKFLSENRTSGILGMVLSVPTITLATMIAMELAESPKERVLKAISEFYIKIKALETNNQTI